MEKKHLDYNYFIVLMTLILAWKEHDMHKKYSPTCLL